MKHFYIIKNAMPAKGKYPVIGEQDKKDEVKAIKAGFNWLLFLSLLVTGILFGFLPAFVFLFWAICYRLWLVALIGSIAYLASYALLLFLSFNFLEYLNPEYFLEYMLDPFEHLEVGLFIGIGIGLTLVPLFSFIVGYKANEWRVEGLEKKGCDIAGMIQASSKKAAIKLYLEEQQSDK